MQRGAFPDPATFNYPAVVAIGQYRYRSADVVAFGTPLTPANVREAYMRGIFPWHTDGMPLPWHCPEYRAVLEFADLRVPRSLEKARRASKLSFTIDQDFPQVMRECALSRRPGQLGTWITAEFVRVFTQLHLEGLVHSVEAWDEAGAMVGGLYGVDAAGVFCGESMFYKSPNASKLCLLHLVDHLRSRGATWLDNQVMTPHFELLGAKDIQRGEFLARLRHTQGRGLVLFD